MSVSGCVDVEDAVLEAVSLDARRDVNVACEPAGRGFKVVLDLPLEALFTPEDVIAYSDGCVDPQTGLVWCDPSLLLADVFKSLVESTLIKAGLNLRVVGVEAGEDYTTVVLAEK